LIKHQRYAHAHQFKRANRSLRKLKTYLGRVIRDIERRIIGNEDLREAFVRPLYLARRVPMVRNENGISCGAKTAKDRGSRYRPGYQTICIAYSKWKARYLLRSWIRGSASRSLRAPMRW